MHRNDAASDTALASGAWTVLPFSQTNTLTDVTIGPQQGQITINKTGRYRVSGTMAIGPSLSTAVAGRYVMSVFKAGVEFRRLDDQTLGADNVLGGTAMVRFTAGDVVDLRVFAVPSGATAIRNSIYTGFEGNLLSSIKGDKGDVGPAYGTTAELQYRPADPRPNIAPGTTYVAVTAGKSFPGLKAGQKVKYDGSLLVQHQTTAGLVGAYKRLRIYNSTTATDVEVRHVGESYAIGQQYQYGEASMHGVFTVPTDGTYSFIVEAYQSAGANLKVAELDMSFLII